MSQTFFSKQDPSESLSRLNLLGSSKGSVTLWLKGKDQRYTYLASRFDKERMEIVLDSRENKFKKDETVLCTFSLRGLTYFSEVVFQIGMSGHDVIQFKNQLYKSERRSSYRLLTFPIYEVWAEFDLDNTEDNKVLNLKKSGQTALFKNFLKIIEDKPVDEEQSSKFKIRIQDLSTTGMALQVGELENGIFEKDMLFKDVNISFADEIIAIPTVKVVYVVDYISNDKNSKQYKIGLHFENLPMALDDKIGKKINSLLRENDFNKDFENFIK